MRLGIVLYAVLALLDCSGEPSGVYGSCNPQPTTALCSSAVLDAHAAAREPIHDLAEAETFDAAWVGVQPGIDVPASVLVLDVGGVERSVGVEADASQLGGVLQAGEAVRLVANHDRIELTRAADGALLFAIETFDIEGIDTTGLGATLARGAMLCEWSVDLGYDCPPYLVAAHELDVTASGAALHVAPGEREPLTTATGSFLVHNVILTAPSENTTCGCAPYIGATRIAIVRTQ